MITSNNRINRRTYFVTSFLASTAYFAVSISLSYVLIDNQLFSALINLLDLALIAVIAYISVCLLIKRLHDVGLPGIYALLLLIPLAAAAFLFIPGQDKKNQYGKPPKPGIDYKAFTI